jgi:GTP-binding protein
VTKIREERVYKISDLPKKRLPEIAIIGRSNSGKSSLLNLLIGKKIAKVSKTPGCTLWLGLHEFEGALLVDLPGYGYAKAPGQRLKVVDELVEEYLNLRRPDAIFLLVDSRRGVLELDHEMMELFSWAQIKIVATKADKKDSLDHPDFDFITSSLKRSGIDELKSFIKAFGKK